MTDSTALPLSIGARCINKDWFGMSMDEVWEIMGDYLYFISHAYHIRIHSFVLMSNHFHMIASAPEGNLPEAMRYLQSQNSRQITKSAGRINHTWRAKYFRTLMTSPSYYLHAYKYFYRNPVEAKICNFVEEYPYSTLHGLLGFSKLVIPVFSDDTLFNDVEGTLKWLNCSPKEGHQDIIRRALKRSEFKIPRNPKDGSAHPLEDEPY